MANFSLRDVPDELYQQIKEIAEQERRSINQQILVILERAMQQHRPFKADVLERIDRRREAIAGRVRTMLDSTEQVVADRQR